MTPKEQAARQALVALEDVMADFDGSWALADTAITALREALNHSADADKMIGCAYCNNPLFAGTKCNNCGRVTLAEQAEQKQFDMEDHPPHHLCECRKCMEYFTPLPNCDAFAASGKPIAEQEPVLRGDDKFAPHERPQKLEPVTISCECGDIYERDSFGGRFIKLHGICPNCDAVPQAEQKPVAVVEITYGREPECYVTGNIYDFPEGVFKLYTRPVRTKDLTDDEVDEIFAEYGTIPNTKAVRAVIAADREKNK